MSFESRAGEARARMVAALRSWGTDERILRAFDAVPREALVPEIYELGRRRPVGAGDLATLYDATHAIGVNENGTSTASAPNVLATQLEVLKLERGMSVLEIGTGPGYFAALIAELVGETGRVITVDIDGELTALAANRLADLGYHNITVVTADGHFGAPDDAPFDRVIASVGCDDVSATWLTQLSDSGSAVVPLRHGCEQPTMSVERDGRGAIVMRTGYVAIQGAQRATHLWPNAGVRHTASHSERLPADLAGALRVERGREGIGGLAEWDLSFWLAVTDQRAAGRVSLCDGTGSTASIEAVTSALWHGGPSGSTLATELTGAARAWLAAGRPTISDYRHQFVPLGSVGERRTALDHSVVDSGARSELRWQIDRVDHTQVIELPGDASR